MNKTTSSSRASRCFLLSRYCAGALVCVLLAPVVGCKTWDVWPFGSEEERQKYERHHARLVGDLARPWGTQPVTVEAVGLVTCLNDTGSDPPPSPQRGALMDDMLARGVRSPNSILASKKTSMVVVRGVLRPAIQKGERFDVEVRVLSQSDTTSLRGGKLLSTRLQEMAVLGNQVRSGRMVALAEGPILVDPSAEEEGNRILATRGRILGGGVAMDSRPIYLMVKPEHKSVWNSARVAKAINRRFHYFDKGIQQGVANAQTDERITLQVPPRYRENLPRYLEVIRSVALTDTPAETMKRMATLENQLLDPLTASRAALELEAYGKQSIEVLKKGLSSDNLEVRFRAAEALAYLDVDSAAKVLAEAAVEEPAFRVFALGALSAMDCYAAEEQLLKLLEGSSAETRYGAFRALTAMDTSNPQIRGEMLGDAFHYHVLDIKGEPMVHVTRNRRPEVVIFGRNPKMNAPFQLEAGNEILIIGRDDAEVTVSRFAVGQPDQKRTISNNLDEIIRAVVELGGTYPDVVQALQQAKKGGALPGRFEVEAIPQAGRRFDRIADIEEESDAPTEEEKAGFFRRFARLFASEDPEASLEDEDEAATEETDEINVPSDSPKELDLDM